MRIFLSALGWVAEPPEGNRLRWSYPVSSVRDGAYVGLPDRLVVERAPISADFVFQRERSGIRPWGSSLTPDVWWERLGSVGLGPWPAPLDLKGSQGVRFTFLGPASRVLALDAVAGGFVFDRVVHHLDHVVIEGSLLQSLIVLTAGAATLDDLRTLDLFADRPLDWEPIAEVGVAATLTVSLDDVRPRYAADLPTMSDERWGQLLDVAAQAAASEPGVADGTSYWQELEAILGVRWEHAVLAAWGFVDGPHPEGLSGLDGRLGGILGSIPGTPVAYRVVDPSGRLEVDHSTIAIVLNTVAPRPDTPGGPAYEDPEVRLTQDGRFEATYAMRWSDPDPAAIGVRFEEVESASPSVGGDPQRSGFFHRTRMAAEQPGTGVVARRRDVAFHDVTLTARASAIDAWDRESDPSPWSSPTLLSLRHSPQPPPLAFATMADGRVFLHRAVPQLREDGTFAPGPTEDWTPDEIVRQAPGRVQVLRRVGALLQVEVTVGDPWPLSGGEKYSVRVSDPAAFDASRFVGGTLIVGRVRVRVESVFGAEIRFTPSTDGRLNPVVFGAGSGTLQQDPGDPGLWTEVTSLSVFDLPPILLFTDSIGVGDEAVTLTYATRVEFLGRFGPIGNPVTLMVLPVTPRVPPPFTVLPLGRDFYSRTLVRVDLLQPQPGDRFTLWWADGWQGDPGWPVGVPFEDRAAPGEHGSQKAYAGTTLYDVLPLPIPGVRERRVTFGLQRINGAGGQSRFSVVQDTLPTT